MIYPILMVVVSAAIVGFMMAVVVPRITEIYADQGQTLPFVTELLIGVSSFFSSWRVLILIAVVGGGIYWFRNWKETESGRAQWDRFVLKIPVAGPLIRLIAVARFSRTMATLLSSGVQLLNALDIVKNILGNTVLVRVVEQARLNIREGESIAIPLKRSGEFPPMLTHMISIGEETGALEEMLDNVADTYEQQVESRLQGLTSILEPAMIVVMGGVVGIIVFAIIQPILQLSQGSLGV
jgi:general secretion pathway protein F